MCKNRKEGMMNRSRKKKDFRCFFIAWIVMLCSIIWGGCESTDHAVILGMEKEENADQAILAEEKSVFESPKEETVQVDVDGQDRQDQTKIDTDVMERMAVVHVCGQVKNPGVYELPDGSRKNDAIEAAGGFTAEADVSYINLAQILTDGDQIYVPCEGEETKKPDERSETDGTKTGTKVNLNTADEERLCTLPGIGVTRAKQIIAYRESNGSFRDVRDIMNVSGIKESVFEKISELVTVE